MSAAKHQPASLLPWEARESLTGASIDHVYSAGARNGAKSIGCFKQSEDAAFALHAANAYSKLVEALREATESLDDLMRAPKAKHFRQEEATRFYALLRDLGEGL